MASIQGLNRWNRWIDNLPQEVREEAKEIVKQAGYDTEADAKMNVPVDGGDLRRSINTSIEEDGMVAVVGTNMDYALSVEFGSKPHKIKIKNKQALSNGGDFFGDEVNHPGNQAQPFLTPAYVKNKFKLRRKLQELANSIEGM